MYQFPEGSLLEKAKRLLDEDSQKGFDFIAEYIDELKAELAAFLEQEKARLQTE